MHEVDLQSIVYTAVGGISVAVSAMAGYIVKLHQKLFDAFDKNTTALIEFKEIIKRDMDTNRVTMEMIRQDRDYYTQKIDDAVDRVVSLSK